MVLLGDSSVPAAFDSSFQQQHSQISRVLQMLPKNWEMEMLWPWLVSEKRSQITPRLFKLLPESAARRAGFSKPVQWFWASWSLPIFASSKMGAQRQHTALSVTNVFSRKNIFILKKSQWTLLTIYRNILTENFYNYWLQNAIPYVACCKP